MRRYIRDLEKVVITMIVNKDNSKDSYKSVEVEREIFNTKRSLNNDTTKLKKIDVQKKIVLRRMQRLEEIKSKGLYASTRRVANVENKDVIMKVREHDTKVNRGRENRIVICYML
jgi:hypothetical protein